MNRRTMTLLINFSKFVHLLICAQNGSRKPILQNNAFLLMRHCVLSRDGLVLKCIIDYCSKMGGVDLMDELTQYHEISRRSLKWSRKFIFYLIDICLVNAYCLHTKFASPAQKLSQYDFRKSIVEALIADAPNAKKPAKRGGRRSTPTSNEATVRLTERHFSSYIPAAPNSKRKHATRDCICCNLPPSARVRCRRVQTSHWCEICEAPLCYPNCFQLFHTYTNYKQEARRRGYGFQN